MKDILRKDVWQGLLTADLNARFWDGTTRVYQEAETWFKVFLGVVTSGAIAGWYLIKQHPTFWFYITSIASLLSNLVIPRFKWPTLIINLQAEKKAWETLLGSYENLWREVELDSPETDIKSKLESLTEKCARQAGKNVLPKSPILRWYIERQVIKARTPRDEDAKQMAIIEINPNL